MTKSVSILETPVFFVARSHAPKVDRFTMAFQPVSDRMVKNGGLGLLHWMPYWNSHQRSIRS